MRIGDEGIATELARRNDIVNLKPEYQLALARDGYGLVTSELPVFKVEA